MLVDSVTQIPVKVNIDTNTALKCLVYNLFHRQTLNNLVVKDDKLYEEIDMSIHGSPSYTYNLISDDKNIVEIFKHIKDIFNLLKN